MALHRIQIRQVQQDLQKHGYYMGRIDGIAGPKTHEAAMAWCAYQFGATAPEMPPPPLSLAAEKLIIDFEVGGGQKYYDQKLRKPTYPGADSGVTIGIGYDLGYVDKDEFLRDWSMLDSGDLVRLAQVIGFTGYAAKIALPKVSDIEIHWEDALTVFRSATLIKFIKLTQGVFHGCDDLPDDVFGALVSLVFNRGTSLKGPRREEMRNIALHVKNCNLSGIAQELRKMARLWEGMDVYHGLKLRRFAEADLVESAIH